MENKIPNENKALPLCLADRCNTIVCGDWSRFVESIQAVGVDQPHYLELNIREIGQLKTRGKIIH